MGRRFVVRPDHASLVWLMRFKYPGGQICRWLEALSDYDFIIQHRRGHRPVIAMLLVRSCPVGDAIIVPDLTSNGSGLKRMWMTWCHCH